MICGHVHIKNEAEQFNRFVKALKDEYRPEKGVNRGQIFNVGCMLPHMKYTPRTLNELIKSS